MRKIKIIIAALLCASMLSGCAGTAGTSESVSSADTTSGTTAADTTAATTTFAPDTAAAITATSAETSAPVDESTSSAATSAPAEVTTEQTSSAQPEDTTSTPEDTTPQPEEITTATVVTTTAPEEIPPQEEVMEEKIIALTFDDGPNTTTTAQVLDVLEKYNVTASFFLIGDNINDESAKIVKRAYDMGCEIHNHSKSHPNMYDFSAEDVLAEFQYTDNKIFEITGERSKFFRPPYISVSNTMLDALDVPFIAGVGCNDWEPKITADRRAMSILKQVKDGDIILLHDAEGNTPTVEALDTIIPELKKQGYKFVTVSELFELSGVEISPTDKKIYTNINQQYQYN